MKIKNLAITILLISMVLTGVVFAHGDHCDGEKSDHGHTAHECMMAKYKMETGGFLIGYKKELSLTEDQCEKLVDMSRNLCKRMHDRKEEIGREKNELKKMLNSVDLDIPAIENQMKKINNLDCAFKAECLAEFQKAREILTEDQKSRLAEILKRKK